MKDGKVDIKNDMKKNKKDIIHSVKEVVPRIMCLIGGSALVFLGACGYFMIDGAIDLIGALVYGTTIVIIGIALIYYGVDGLR